jgi:DNA-binding CsgD family transcriptional regulator
MAISRDGVHFQRVFELHEPFIEQLNQNGLSYFGIVNRLDKDAQIAKCNHEFRDYRLQLWNGEGWFELSELHKGESCKDSMNFSSLDAEVLDRKRALYATLTIMEKKILAFLYSGYKKDLICKVFDISINTFRTHRKNIYRKLGFMNMTDLMMWCDGHLELLFDIKRPY